MPTPAQHKDALVRTTMRLFRRQGYASTGLQQILAESGAPKGSLYYYFPGGKEELAVAAVQMASSMILAMLRDLADRHGDPAEFVAAYCRKMAGWMAESDFRSGSPITTVMLETAPDNAAITQAGLAAYESWIALIGDVFSTAGMPADIAVKRAESLITAMEGALILARVRLSDQPILDQASRVRDW